MLAAFGRPLLPVFLVHFMIGLSGGLAILSFVLVDFSVTLESRLKLSARLGSKILQVRLEAFYALHVFAS